MGRLALVALVCCGLAFAGIAQGSGWNQNAHLALVRALSHGHTTVDQYRNTTGDLAWYHGHYYTAKAPGLALLTTPVYLVLEHTGTLSVVARATRWHTANDGILWALGLIGCVVPAFAILLMVRRLGDELEPGFGAVAAVTVGLGSLLLPFATLFFDHVLSAAFGLGAFSVAFLHRDRAWLVGILAGLAIVSEYTLAMFAVAVGIYVLTRAGARQFGMFVLGGALGLLPLLIFNALAYGSIFHLSYENAISVRGVSGHDVLGANARGFFGFAEPSLHTGVALLFASIGLLRLAPVLAAGVAGWVVSGRRVEATFVLVLVAAFLVFNSGYDVPFGGNSPGPRFLLPVLPLLGIGLAPAWRRWPVLTALLAVPSIAAMVGVTISTPILAVDGHWLGRIRGSITDTSWLVNVAPVCVFAALALVFVVRASERPRFTRADAAAGAIAFGGWLLLAFSGHRLLDADALGRSLSALVVAALAVAVVGAAVWARRATTLVGARA